ncbi:glycoside hydrolase family 73 protein [Acidithiobacillus caldus]
MNIDGLEAITASQKVTVGTPVATHRRPETLNGGSQKAANHFLEEARAAQRFVGMFLDEVLGETMPNLFGGVLGAQTYQTLFLQSFSQEMVQSPNGSMGLMELLEKNLHIPKSAVQALENHPSISAMGQGSGSVAGPTAISENPLSFVRTIWPLVQKAAKQLDVSAKFILAQAALETGWGSSVVGNNLFGIKATPGAPSVLSPTQEANAHGTLYWTMAAFRDYPDMASCVQHYVDLMKSAYPGVVGAGDNVQAFVRGLAAGHYATDPNYAQKLLRIVQSPALAGIQ